MGENNEAVVSIRLSVYNKALNILMDAEMPKVIFKKDDPLSMANEAIEKLRTQMREIAILLQSGNPQV